MIDKRFTDIEKADIDLLLTNQVRESRTIEYKRELPAKSEQAKQEFCADASSFANAAGGDLVFGVIESNGKPSALVGLASINADHEMQRLQNILREGIEPRIPGVQTNAFDDFKKGPCIVVRIPRSWAGPHMVRSSNRFYARNSNGKASMSVTEIRAGFLHSERLSDRIRQFRDERIGQILAGETPVALHGGALRVLHLIPVELWASGEQIDVSTFVNHTHALPAPAGNRCPNLDGFLGYAPAKNTGEGSSGYAQLFRHGAVEAVDRMGERQVDDYWSIPGRDFERYIIRDLQGYIRLFNQMDIGGDLIAFLTLLDVRNHFLAGGGDTSALREERLLFPELLIPETSWSDVPTVSKSLFDHVWQAFGAGQSPYYHSDGKWIDS